MDPVPEKTVFVPRQAAATDLFQTGDVVGQYQVEKVLGAGGMGVVYGVKHTALKKKFALKALPAVLAQEQSFVRRFKSEATNLAKLNHNHIVNVTDFGESQGRLYLVLEYVEGGTLEEWFEKNRKPESGAPPADVQRLIGQVLLGLTHAHEAGIIHRDLKPANVLLDKTGQAKISDFGLARAVSDEEYRRSGGTASPFQGDSVTTTGAIVGTIDFMSPEARNMQTSDARSDIYAVGVMAYYLLTGKKPHGMAKDASKLVPGLDLRWDRFIATCLAENPTQRYQTAAAAYAGLQQMRQSGGPKPWLWPVVAAVVVAVGVGIWKWPHPAAPTITPSRLTVGTQSPASTAVAPAQPGPTRLAPEAPVNRKFVVAGLPAGAVVYYRGNHPAGAAGRVMLDFPPGAQAVRIKAPGYLDWEGELGAVEGEKESIVPMEQVPPHPVRFTGLPGQAQLKVGGNMVVADNNGTAEMDLRPGHFTVQVNAPKYEPLDLGIDVLQTTENITLEKMKLLPPNAEVIVQLPKGGELKFRWVAPGDFYLGSPPDERGRQSNDLPRTRKQVTKGFYIAVTEMTQQQHRALTGKNPSTSRALGDDTRPVEQVAWRDLAGTGGVLDKANELLHRLDLPFKADLPTEVEWEYACRAGTDSSFNNGSQITNERDDPALNSLASYSRGGSQDAPSPVAKFKANKWGLYDMHGNVAEWAYGIRGARDPVVRGGNWKVGPVHCRSASRVELTPETRSTDTMGYRLVLRPTEN